jgi:hypothetical protein
MADKNSGHDSGAWLPKAEIVKLAITGLVALFVYLLIAHPAGFWELLSQSKLIAALHKPQLSEIFIIVYLVLFFLARHYWISKPGLNHLEAELRGLELRLRDNNNVATNGLVELIAEEIAKIRNDVDQHKVRQFIFGNTGKKISCWRRYHEIERMTIALLPKEAIRQKLFVTAEDLTLFGSGSARALRDNILKTLAEQNPDEVLMRHQLVESMKQIDDDRDNLYQYLADWQNKATYLIGITILIILYIFTGPNSILFHFGMIGGLLAKLRGVINRNNIPADYGVSWATLFLTPLVGGITGWTAILLLNFINNMGWFDLQKLLSVSWEEAHTSSSALALALVFGYSATLFEKVLDKVQGEMEKKSKILKN